MSDGIKDGGPIYPSQFVTVTGEPAEEGKHGMSLRDWFAGQAVSGWLASYGPTDGANTVYVAEFAYQVADSMLKERLK